jgi:hypothetical protein
MRASSVSLVSRRPVQHRAPERGALTKANPPGWRRLVYISRYIRALPFENLEVAIAFVRADAPDAILRCTVLRWRLARADTPFPRRSVDPRVRNLLARTLRFASLQNEKGRETRPAAYPG